MGKADSVTGCKLDSLEAVIHHGRSGQQSTFSDLLMQLPSTKQYISVKAENNLTDNNNIY